MSTTLESIPGTRSLTAAPHYAFVPPDDNEQRLAIRAGLKVKRAEAKLASARLEEIDRAIVAAKQAIDDLAAQHVADCAPIQAGLKDLDRESVERLMSDADPFDAALSERRETLRNELAARNLALKTATEERQSVLDALEQERYQVATQASWQEFDQKLMNLARPDLAMAARIATTTTRWAAKRHNSAEIMARESQSAYARAEVEASAKLLFEAQRAEAEAMELARETD